MLDGEVPFSVKTDDSVWNLSDSKDGRVLEVRASQAHVVRARLCVEHGRRLSNSSQQDPHL